MSVLTASPSLVDWLDGHASQRAKIQPRESFFFWATSFFQFFFILNEISSKKRKGIVDEAEFFRKRMRTVGRWKNYCVWKIDLGLEIPGRRRNFVVRKKEQEREKGGRRKIERELESFWFSFFGRNMKINSPGRTTPAAETRPIGCSSLFPGYVTVGYVTFGRVRVAQPGGRRGWTQMTIHRCYYYVVDRVRIVPVV